MGEMMKSFTLESAKRFEQLEKLVEAKDKELERQREQQREREERLKLEHQLHSTRGENQMLLSMAEIVANRLMNQQQQAQPAFAMLPPHYYGMQDGYGGHAFVDTPVRPPRRQGTARGRETINYQGYNYKVFTGPRGGKYIMRGGRKRYDVVK